MRHALLGLRQWLSAAGQAERRPGMLGGRRIAEAEQPSWLERAKQKLRQQGTPWLAACVLLVRSLAVELWGLGMPDRPAAAGG